MEGRTVDYGGIGWAVNHMRLGHQMRRRAWKNVEWAGYVPEGSTQIPQKFGGSASGAFLVAKTSGGLIAWTATQSDLLASDWELVNATKPGEYHAEGTQAQTQA